MDMQQKDRSLSRYLSLYVIQYIFAQAKPGVEWPSLSPLFKKTRENANPHFPSCPSFFFIATALSASFPLLHRENRLYGIAHTLSHRSRSANDEDLLKIGMRIQVGINRHRQIRLFR